MIENWWKAHELEIYMAIAILGALAFGWVLSAVVTVRRERKRKREDGLL